MTHKLFELDKMNREQLESIANELNIKGIKKLDNENLAYQILDAEAREESVKPAPESKPKARRGRPAKKNEAEPAPKAEEAAPKKQKAPKAESPAPEKPVQEAAAAEKAQQQEAPAAKKRGRKPKNAAPAQEAAQEPAKEQQPEAKPQEEPKAPQAQPNQQQNNHPQGGQQQQQRQRFQNNNQQPQRPRVPEFEGTVEATGVLEIMPDGYGFLRSSDYNYLNSPDDIYVSQQQIKVNALKSGDTVTGEIRPPREGDKYFPLVRINSVNGRSIEFIRDRVPFDFLTPLFPDEKFNLTGCLLYIRSRAGPPECSRQHWEKMFQALGRSFTETHS